MHRRLAIVFVACAFAISGCAGSGSSSAPVTQPSPATGGQGTTVAIDQKVTFSIIVPAAAPAGLSKARTTNGTRRLAAATPAPTTPYLSPATAAIVLTLAEINGLSPQKAPPAIPAIPVTCQACTFSVPNVPAALGTNRYFVQTYSAITNGKAAGNLISTGFVDVAVPAANPPAIGGAATLSVGGYVAQISLAPASVNFLSGVAGDQNILVRALDAGGATIIGAVQYVTPIVVSVSDCCFLVDGVASESIVGTLQKPIVLHYNGGNSYGTVVQAASQNENGLPVSASPLIANVVYPTPAPGVSPTAPPPPPPPTAPPAQTSLYVADTATDTISEYGYVAQLVTGSVSAPRRVIKFDPTLAFSKIPTLACTYSIDSPFTLTTGNGTNGVTVAADGTIFTFPTCADTNGNTFVFGFSPTSVGAVAPTVIDTITTGGMAQALAITPPGTPQTVFAEFYTGATNALAGFSTQSNGQPQSVLIGTTCYQEFGQPPCSSGTGSFSTPYLGGGFGLDANGNSYLPAYWVDSPTGDAANISGPAALLVVPDSHTNLASPVQSAIAGLTSLLGITPIAATVDGSTLYVLVGGTPNLISADYSTSYYQGLSACPPPSFTAPVNTIWNVDSNGNPTPPSTCVDGVASFHNYLVAYTLNGQLLGQAARNMDVDLGPQFALGGDIVGGFGCPSSSGASGQYLAASAGYVYVINQYPTCADPTNPVYAPEVDVYNTNGLTGSHTDIAPVAKIPLSTANPVALAIGPAGTVTGGQAVLRLPATRGFRSYLHQWRRPVASKRKVLRAPYLR